MNWTSSEAFSLSLEDGSVADYCRKRYRAEMYRLRINHLNGANPTQIVAGRAALIDRLLRIVWDAAIHAQTLYPKRPEALSPVAWVALGNYGTCELTPHAPVGILVLGRSTPKVEETVELEKTWNVIRGLGFEASLLLPKECFQRFQSDFLFSLSFLNARYLAGDRRLFDEVYARFRSTVFKNRLVFVYELSRHLKQLRLERGESVYSLESDVEVGAGGLCEFRALLSSIRVLTGSVTVEKALASGQLGASEWKRLLAARQHLLKIQNHLHFLCNKRQDWLSQENAERAAELLGYQNSRFQKRTEIFLRDTLRHRRRIYTTLNEYLDWAKASFSDGTEHSQVQYLRLNSAKDTSGKEKNPERWMKFFRFSQTQPMLFDDQSKSSIRLRLNRWENQTWNTPTMHEEFRLVLKNKGKVAETLRAMRESGFLGRYLPEFGRLDCLVEMDRAHKYSADEHTLKCIEVLDEVASSSDPVLHDYQRVMEQVSDPWLVYFALLLHDAGKGLGPAHALKSERLAAGALQRMNVDRQSREKILLLVREHMLLGQVSQRRDIDDPLTIQEASTVVETADNLNMLLLLTYADLRSVGANVWTEHKDFLLWSLYFKVFDHLMFGDEISEPEHAQVATIQQKVLEHLAPELDTDTVLRHFLLLPEKYSLYTPVPQILSHIRLCERLQERPVVTEWIPHPQAGYTELVLSTRDLPGRFAQIAGSLAALGLSILSAQLNTREDGIVIDTFQVCDSDGRAIVDKLAWNRIDNLLIQVISGEKKLDLLLESRLHEIGSRRPSSSMVPRVRIDNEISSQSTVIEVQTEDQLGLGYLIAKALADLGLNIISAKLSTERNHAFDVFYVQTHAGEKVTSSSRMTEIMERLRFQLNVASA